jgi:hypothetical protein
LGKKSAKSYLKNNLKQKRARDVAQVVWLQEPQYHPKQNSLFGILFWDLKNKRWLSVFVLY